MMDSKEAEAMRRAKRRLRAAVVDYRQHNDGQFPTELKVSPSTMLLFRSHGMVDDESYCEKVRAHLRIA